MDKRVWSCKQTNSKRWDQDEVEPETGGYRKKEYLRNTWEKYYMKRESFI